MESLIQKIKQGVVEVQNRSICNLSSKLNSKIVDISEIIKLAYDLPGILLNWINQHQDQYQKELLCVLQILLEISNNSQGAQLLINYGSVEFLAEFQEKQNKSIQTQVRGILEILMNFQSNKKQENIIEKIRKSDQSSIVQSPQIQKNSYIDLPIKIKDIKLEDKNIQNQLQTNFQSQNDLTIQLGCKIFNKLEEQSSKGNVHQKKEPNKLNQQNSYILTENIKNQIPCQIPQIISMPVINLCSSDDKHLFSLLSMLKFSSSSFDVLITLKQQIDNFPASVIINSDLFQFLFFIFNENRNLVLEIIQNLLKKIVKQLSEQKKITYQVNFSQPAKHMYLEYSVPQVSKPKHNQISQGFTNKVVENIFDIVLNLYKNQQIGLEIFYIRNITQTLIELIRSVQDQQTRGKYARKIMNKILDIFLNYENLYDDFLIRPLLVQSVQFLHLFDIDVVEPDVANYIDILIKCIMTNILPLSLLDNFDSQLKLLNMYQKFLQAQQIKKSFSISQNISQIQIEQDSDFQKRLTELNELIISLPYEKSNIQIEFYLQLYLYSLLDEFKQYQEQCRQYIIQIINNQDINVILYQHILLYMKSEEKFLNIRVKKCVLIQQFCLDQQLFKELIKNGFTQPENIEVISQIVFKLLLSCDLTLQLMINLETLIFYTPLFSCSGLQKIQKLIGQNSPFAMVILLVCQLFSQDEKLRKSAFYILKNESVMATTFAVINKTIELQDNWVESTFEQLAKSSKNEEDLIQFYKNKKNIDPQKIQFHDLDLQNLTKVIKNNKLNMQIRLSALDQIIEILSIQIKQDYTEVLELIINYLQNIEDLQITQRMVKLLNIYFYQYKKDNNKEEFISLLRAQHYQPIILLLSKDIDYQLLKCLNFLVFRPDIEQNALLKQYFYIFSEGFEHIVPKNIWKDIYPLNQYQINFIQPQISKNNETILKAQSEAQFKLLLFGIEIPEIEDFFLKASKIHKIESVELLKTIRYILQNHRKNEKFQQQLLEYLLPNVLTQLYELTNEQIRQKDLYIIQFFLILYELLKFQRTFIKIYFQRKILSKRFDLLIVTSIQVMNENSIPVFIKFLSQLVINTELFLKISYEEIIDQCINKVIFLNKTENSFKDSNLLKNLLKLLVKYLQDYKLSFKINNMFSQVSWILKNLEHRNMKIRILSWNAIILLNSEDFLKQYFTLFETAIDIIFNFQDSIEVRIICINFLIRSNQIIDITSILLQRNIFTFIKPQLQKQLNNLESALLINLILEIQNRRPTETLALLNNLDFWDINMLSLGCLDQECFSLYISLACRLYHSILPQMHTLLLTSTQLLPSLLNTMIKIKNRYLQIDQDSKEQSQNERQISESGIFDDEFQRNIYLSSQFSDKKDNKIQIHQYPQQKQDQTQLQFLITPLISLLTHIMWISPIQTCQNLNKLEFINTLNSIIQLLENETVLQVEIWQQFTKILSQEWQQMEDINPQIMEIIGNGDGVLRVNSQCKNIIQPTLLKQMDLFPQYIQGLKDETWLEKNENFIVDYLNKFYQKAKIETSSCKEFANLISDMSHLKFLAKLTNNKQSFLPEFLQSLYNIVLFQKQFHQYNIQIFAACLQVPEIRTFLVKSKFLENIQQKILIIFNNKRETFTKNDNFYTYITIFELLSFYQNVIQEKEISEMLFYVLRIKNDINRKVLLIFTNTAIVNKNAILAIKNFESTFFAILTSSLFDIYMKALASQFFINLMNKSNQALAFLHKLNVTEELQALEIDNECQIDKNQMNLIDNDLNYILRDNLQLLKKALIQQK